MSIADLSTTAGSNLSINGQSIQGSATANTIDSMFQATAALLAQFYDDIGGVGAVGGTADAITLTSGSGFVSLTTGLVVAFKAASANTDAATLDVDTLGARAIRRQGDIALAAGDIIEDGIYLVRYDADYNASSGAWVLLNRDALDADLAAIAALSPSNNDIIQRKSGAWTNRTMSQLASDLSSLVGGGWTKLGSSVNLNSGTTVTVTSIPTGYQRLELRVVYGVGFASAESLQIETSKDNGSSWTSARTVSAATSSGSGYISLGVITLDGANSDIERAIIPFTRTNSGTNYTTMAAGSGGPINAIRFSGVGGAAFNRGTIEIWGQK